ncbi:MAG: thymidine phosphorylase [Verrucomicrobiae bacterium]|nr:thymidine phosphorylase [Verrucomicrobiae bacterium]MDW7980245.1 thymidine phosphorylase [Verrucomicrobiales bacterium]
MNFLALLERKRDGQQLAPGQIRQVIQAYVAGQIPEYQMAAFLMAVYFRGLRDAETTALTLAMRDSGEVLQFPKDHRPLVDKHSTGGVGDKVSLPLVPLLACLGFRVPMISGRGLGITGGTLDKLESIPGFQTMLPAERIVETVQTVGCVICGQTDRMVPADKKLYALRDVTGTVPSIPLIVASIMSKKLAENLDALVLDVKFGRAAFMQTKAEARKLAKAMVALGNRCGVNTRALLTNMDAPIGRAAGNWLEVKEAVELLDCGTVEPPGRFNDSPIQRLNDLRELVLSCAAHLLVQTRMAKSFKHAYKQAEECLKSGAPRRKWDEMLAAQGADLAEFNRKLARDHTAPVVLELKSGRAGFISKCDARIIGEVIRDLGAGRLTKESKIDHDVGVDRLAKPGDKVQPGSVLCRIHAATAAAAESALPRLYEAFAISARQPAASQLVAGVI